MCWNNAAIISFGALPKLEERMKRSVNHHGVSYTVSIASIKKILVNELENPKKRKLIEGVMNVILRKVISRFLSSLLLM